MSKLIFIGEIRLPSSYNDQGSFYAKRTWLTRVLTIAYMKHPPQCRQKQNYVITAQATIDASKNVLKLPTAHRWLGIPVAPFTNMV